LEIGFSAQSAQDYDFMNEMVVAQLVPIPVTIHVEDRARSLQRSLVARGQHRPVSVSDLLIAATAAVEGLTVLHYGADFDIIAEFTQQPMERGRTPGEHLMTDATEQKPGTGRRRVAVLVQ